LAQRGVRVVDYTGWELIDAHERATGEPHGRPRVKLTSRDQMLHIASN
jgi:ferredoxin/flavodoxin---NADP+ reductase